MVDFANRTSNSPIPRCASLARFCWHHPSTCPKTQWRVLETGPWWVMELVVDSWSYDLVEIVPNKIVLFVPRFTGQANLTLASSLRHFSQQVKLALRCSYVFKSNFCLCNLIDVLYHTAKHVYSRVWLKCQKTAGHWFVMICASFSINHRSITISG